MRVSLRKTNMVTGNPRTREKTMWKQVQGMGGLRFWDFQVYRTGTWSFSGHMVFLGIFLADPETQNSTTVIAKMCYSAPVISYELLLPCPHTHALASFSGLLLCFLVCLLRARKNISERRSFLPSYLLHSGTKKIMKGLLFQVIYWLASYSSQWW